MTPSKDIDLFPSKDDIVNFIRQKPRKISQREISRAFSIKGTNRLRLKSELKSLVKQGVIIKVNSKNFIHPKTLPNITADRVTKIFSNGNIECSEDNLSASKSSPKIYVNKIKNKKIISKLNIGDMLHVRLIYIKDNYYEAKIIHFLEQKNNEIYGLTINKNKNLLVRSIIKSKKKYIISESDKINVGPGKLVRAKVLPKRIKGFFM